MNTRLATVADAPRIADIHVRSWQAAYKGLLPPDFLAALDIAKRESMWRSCIEQGGTLYVAENDQRQAIGFINLAKSRDPDLPDATEITALYLDPEYYGSGIGTRFWSEIERTIETPQVFLWVLASNQLGIAFYKKNRFLPDGAQKSFEINGQRFPERRYRKTLPR